MESYKSEFIRFIMETGALQFGEFTTKSGRKSPYFINTGKFRTGAQIGRLGEFYAACIMEHMAAGRIPTDIGSLFGPAYKGIPIAVSTTIALAGIYGRNLGYCFDRKEAKDHGDSGSLVGHIPADGEKVLLVEDVITAGTAVRTVLPLLAEVSDATVAGLVISVDRMEKGTGERSATQELLDDLGIPTFSIVTVEEILPWIEPEHRQAMEAYMDRYCVR